MKRSFLLYFLISVIGVLFIGRLFQLQILKSRNYNPVKNSAVKVMFDFPERGYIYDRNGELLVANQLSYDVTIVPNEVIPLDTIELCSLLKITKEDFLKRFKKAVNYAPWLESVFLKQLAKEDFAFLQEKLHKFQGFNIQKRIIRNYPIKSAANILGYINEVNEIVAKNDDYYEQGELIGKAGVEAQYTASGIPEAIWATGAPAGALFPGSPEVAPVSAAVAATAAPLIAPAIAAANQEVAGLVGGAFIQGGQGYLGAINTGAVGVIESQRVPQGDGITHISAGYRIFDETRSHVGADLSLEYFATDKLTFWGNSSWLSQNEWNPGEENDDDLPFQDFLNAPRFKFRVGMDYMVKDGFQFSLAFQHDDEFNSNQGFYSGVVQEKNLVDASIGYRLSNGVKLDLSSTNLFNQQYRAFPNMPVIGRRVNLRAVFDL